MQRKEGPRREWGDLWSISYSWSPSGILRYMIPTLLERWDLMDGRMEWIPPCILCRIQHPGSSQNHLWCCCCKIGSHLYPLGICPRASWLCLASGPAITASSASSHPQERATPLLLPFPATFWKVLTCSFSWLQSLPGLLLVYIFLEHFIVTVASCFCLFDYLFFFFR